MPECKYCNRSLSPQGLYTHELHCSQNPSNPKFKVSDLEGEGSTQSREEVLEIVRAEVASKQTKPEGGRADEFESNEKERTPKEKVSRIKEYILREGKEGGICPHCGLELDKDDLLRHSLSKNGKDTNLHCCPECENEFSSPSEVAIPELFDYVGELKKRFETLENEMVELVEKSVKEGQTKSEKARLEQAEEVRTEFSKEIESLKEKVKDEIPKEIDERIEKALGKLDGEIQEKLDQQKQETTQEVDKHINIEKGLDARLKPLEKMSRCRHVWEEDKVNGQYYLFCKRCGQEQEGKLFELSEVREGDIKFTVFMDDVHPLTVSAKARTILDALDQMGYPRDTEPDILDYNLGVESEHLIHKIHKLDDSIVIKALPDNPFVESNPDWWDRKEGERILKEEFLGEFLGTANLGKVVGLGERVAGQPCLIGLVNRAPIS